MIPWVGGNLSISASQLCLSHPGLSSVFSGIVPLISTDDSTVADFAAYKVVMELGAGGEFKDLTTICVTIDVYVCVFSACRCLYDFLGGCGCLCLCFQCLSMPL